MINITLHYGGNVSDHRPVELDIELSVTESVINKKENVPFVNWKKLDLNAKELFRARMTQKLDEIVIPFHLLVHGDKTCSDLNHRVVIESYYKAITDAVIYSDSFLPRSSPNLCKPFWSDHLNELKQKSINCVNVWKRNGSPKNGELFTCKKTCVFNYKKAIKDAKKRQASKRGDELHEHLSSRDYDSFWATWRKCYKQTDSLMPRIDGETSEEGIAGAFRSHFCGVYSGNDSPSHLALKNEFERKFNSYVLEHGNESISPHYISWSEMLNVVSRVKIGKSSSGIIRPEHIFYGSEKLILHLHLLFNSMIQHGFVVTDFLKGTITPIVKDSQGDLTSSSNFRGITIGSLFAKMFELAIDYKISHLLDSDPLQFGFKKKTSTSHALYVLRTTVDYFNNRSSTVFTAFLDISKAFDRISHHGLFIKLMERKVPLCLLLILIHWHLNMTCRVKWGMVYSEEFPIPLGMKQGGILSPKFFSLYIDDLIKMLRKKGIGCHVLEMFVACILFADDMALMAPSRSALQKMITICTDYCDKFCLNFNAKKSKVMIFGKQVNSSAPVAIKGENIDVVSELKYLGTTLVSGDTFNFTARYDVVNFFRSTNAITTALTEAHEHTMLHLIYSNCVPILTYASSV